MTDASVHRGPDDEGFYLSGGIGLGHRRLSIIDLAAGHQPMSNEDGTIWVVFNGEIYNFPELRDFLAAKVIFSRPSPTRKRSCIFTRKWAKTVSAHCAACLLSRFGTGQTVSSYWPAIESGKKPFYYYCSDSKTAFASEMKAILQVPGVPREIDPEAVPTISRSYMCLHPNRFLNIFGKLGPGTT